MVGPTPMPEITITMPARNAAEFIDVAIASARAQTFADFELLVLDDGSTDDTAARIQAHARDDRRVRLLRAETSQGVAASRNRLHDAAQGRWITWLDADDAFHRRRLEIMLNQAQLHQADLLADNLEVVDFDHGVLWGDAFETPVSDTPLSALSLIGLDMPSEAGRWPIGFCKPLFRTDFLRASGIRLDLRAHVGSDFLFFLDAVFAGARFVRIAQPLYRYNARSGSVSNGLDAARRVLETHALIEQKHAPAGADVARALKRRRARIGYEIFKHETSQGRWLAAAVALRQVERGYATGKLVTAIRKRLTPVRPVAAAMI